MENITSKEVGGANSTDTYTKPFSTGYVLRITTKHIRKAIDVSIRKTYDRIAEFDNNQAKSREVFITLSTLHAMRKTVDDFQLMNKDGITDINRKS
jgi:hypothetical protein